MATVLELVIGGIAILLGIAWVVWPLQSVYWYNNIIYFWIDEPDTDHVSPTVARIGGVILLAGGLVLVFDLLP